MSRKLTFMSHAFCLKIDNVLSNVSWVGFWLTYQLVASTFSLRLLKRALPRPVLIGSTPQASRVSLSEFPKSSSDKRCRAQPLSQLRPRRAAARFEYRRPELCP